MGIISQIIEGGAVPFPAFEAERIYMVPFRRGSEVRARWRDTVDAMIATITTDKTAFLMVDQKVVFTGEHHRRPGAHVDGNRSRPPVSAHRCSHQYSRRTHDPTHSPRYRRMKMTRAELLALRRKMDLSKSVYDSVGARNVCGRTPEDLVQMDIEMHHAKRQWLDDYINYDRAVKEFTSPNNVESTP